MPDGPERLQHELGLQMIRGLALRMMKGWASPEIEPVFARARELCHQLGDAPQLFPSSGRSRCSTRSREICGSPAGAPTT